MHLLCCVFTPDYVYATQCNSSSIWGGFPFSHCSLALYSMTSLLKTWCYCPLLAGIKKCADHIKNEHFVQLDSWWSITMIFLIFWIFCYVQWAARSSSSFCSFLLYVSVYTVTFVSCYYWKTKIGIYLMHCTVCGKVQPYFASTWINKSTEITDRQQVTIKADILTVCCREHISVAVSVIAL